MNVLIDDRDRVRTILMHRPERLNAFDGGLVNDLADALADAAADPAVAVVVLSGSGRAFSTGADLKALSGVPDADDAEIDRPRPRHLPLAVRKPLIAAVNGPAVGLGFVEALYCDVRFASPEALFVTRFSRLGLVAEYGISWLLPRVVGRSRALDLLMSGRRVDADEAHRIGLVDRVVPADELVDTAVGYAAELATACSPWSMSVIKQQVAVDAEATFLDAAVRADDLMRESFRRPDIAEGLNSFAERRPPAFAPLGPLEPERV